MGLSHENGDANTFLFEVSPRNTTHGNGHPKEKPGKESRDTPSFDRPGPGHVPLSTTKYVGSKGSIM